MNSYKRGQLQQELAVVEVVMSVNVVVVMVKVVVVEVVVVVVSVSVVVVVVKVVQRRKGETERNPNMAELRPRLRGEEGHQTGLTKSRPKYIGL
jgi:MFS superfamily sulfate permease-like transporter